ncbi:MAG: F0F1 ATP synthase subunit gamma [Deltaproteobacteria bacterium]|nr:F0F1 ATP synthase subunit gamma [Deltaproteobacteria bacterium]
MTKRQEMDHQLKTLNEIKSIMTAMKNLAMVEIRKIQHRQQAQRQLSASVAATVSDFLDFHPPPGDRRDRPARVYVLVGSERGFCGGFNESLLREFRQHLLKEQPAVAGVILIGNKLGALLEDDWPVLRQLDGASAAEEVPRVFSTLLECLGELALPREAGEGRDIPELFALHHDHDTRAVEVVNLLDLPRRDTPAHGSPPCLLRPAHEVLQGLVEHHLMSVFTRIFHTSLMAEMRSRLSHMESATSRIETRTGELIIRRNMLRQEEITQEIEIILLSVMDAQGE